MVVKTKNILLIEGKRAENPSYFFTGLSEKGYQVESVRSQNQALEYIDDNHPHIIIIDSTSLRSSGRRICKSVKQKALETPIILILDQNGQLLKQNEANVVLVKPFTIQKVINRIKSLLPVESNNLLKAGSLTLDTENHWVKCGNNKSSLTPRLVEILKVFMKKPGEVIERKKLFKEVWETDYTGDTRPLDVHISWLRKKIEVNPRDPQYLKTIRGVGYRLDVESEPIYPKSINRKK